MISQCSLCITHSPIHTVEYYVKMAQQLIDLGCDEICLKDMAGIGRPETLGKICAGIKAYKKDIIVQYHSHADRASTWLPSSKYARTDATMWIQP